MKFTRAEINGMEHYAEVVAPILASQGGIDASKAEIQEAVLAVQRAEPGEIQEWRKGAEPGLRWDDGYTEQPCGAGVLRHYWRGAWQFVK